MGRLRRLALPLAALGLGLGWTAGARAFVPAPEKIARQVAIANARAGRATGLELRVSVRTGDAAPHAEGWIVSDPRGLARLELRSPDGGVERHLLRGSEYRVSRDGRLARGAEPLLPPLFLLQTRSGDVLLSNLLSMGGRVQENVLGRIGETECYVLGGRDLAPPANPSAAQVGSAGPRASLWVARDGYRVMRIDRADGTRYEMGPTREFGAVRLPAWIAVERAGSPPLRLELIDAEARRLDLGSDFGTDWLLAP